MVRNDSSHDPDGIALLEDVDAEASESADAVTQIDLEYLLEMLLLAVRHHRERHLKRFVLVELRDALERPQLAVNADHGSRAGTKVQIRGAEAHCHAQ